jgi:hypothetical protein
VTGAYGGGGVNAPDVPATPDPPQPKHLRLLGLLDWLPMIVLGSILSLGGAIVALRVELLGNGDLIVLLVFVVVAIAIGTGAAGRYLGWHGTLRWIAAFCINVLILSAITWAWIAPALELLEGSDRAPRPLPTVPPSRD